MDTFFGKQGHPIAALRDHRAADLAATQFGVVSRTQLLDVGFTEDVIDDRLEQAGLHLVTPSVYAVGHPGISRRGRAKAVLLQIGPRAGLSHESAARLWEMKGRSNDGDVHVSVSGRTRSHYVVPEGVNLHRPRNLQSEQLVVHKGLRVTTPERTVLDHLAASSVVDLTRMLEQMVTRLGRSPDDLHTWAHALTKRKGRAKLIEALDWVAGPAVIRSEFEALFRSVCQEAGLPIARTNVRIAGWETDAAWLDERVAVELDSWRFHGGHWQFHQDRRKGLAISKAGFELIRLSWWQLKREPDEVVEALRYALARGRARRLAAVA